MEFLSSSPPDFHIWIRIGACYRRDHDDRSLFNEASNDPRITCIFLFSARFGEFSLYRRVSDHNEVEVLSETCAGDVSCVFRESCGGGHLVLPCLETRRHSCVFLEEGQIPLVILPRRLLTVV